MRLQELVESSGYIPRTESEARDPRWSRALSVDVGINTMREEIKNIYPTAPIGSRHLKLVKESLK
jgi:hypothetical protein